MQSVHRSLWLSLNLESLPACWLIIYCIFEELFPKQLAVWSVYSFVILAKSYSSKLPPVIVIYELQCTLVGQKSTKQSKIYNSKAKIYNSKAVSYTHLTLPTTPYV